MISLVRLRENFDLSGKRKLDKSSLCPMPLKVLFKSKELASSGAGENIMTEFLTSWSAA